MNSNIVDFNQKKAMRVKEAMQYYDLYRTTIFALIKKSQVDLSRPDAVDSF